MQIRSANKNKFALVVLIFIFLMSACVTDENQQNDADEGVEMEETRDVSPAATEKPNTDSESNQQTSESDQAESEEQSYAGDVPAPEFPPGLDWLNVDQPLTMADLRGKIVLLDFWTYGCINCIHIIPDLKKLEEKYADELVVIGVHSAKFENEGDTDNIRNIILRYELEHPVINDNEFQVWSQYGARAWPTLVLIDPDGKVLGYHSGEGIYRPFDNIIGKMIDQFDQSGRIDRTPLELKLEEESQVESPLLFPGKVLADDDNNRLIISDSNHNRIVISDLEGNILEVIGNGQAELKDGDYETSSFFRPQGLTLADDNTLYVADTENHAIRKINLAEQQVETVAGTGDQVYTQPIKSPALSTPLNSPWDVLFEDGKLYIAMAGQHQVWVYTPEDGMIDGYAGSGREELADGKLSQGGLNQPSGLASDGERLYIADSEASAIRTADLDPEGRLETIVGTGLFDFGDVDGTGDEVRLQHPLGVVYRDGNLYVADTYNSKIKIIDPETSESQTYLGGTESGWRDGLDPLFDEPGGLSIGNDKLYIADTNNHVIREVDLDTQEVTTLVLVDNEGLLTRQPEGAEYTGKTIQLEPQLIMAGQGSIQLDLSIPEGFILNDLAPFSMEWQSSGDELSFDANESNRRIVEPEFPINFAAEFSEGESELTGDLVIYYCDDDAESLCFIERVRLTARLIIGDQGQDTVVISHAIPNPSGPATAGG